MTLRKGGSGAIYTLLGYLGRSGTIRQSSMTDEAPAAMLLLMATTMTVPMAGWMRHKGHAWRPTIEMNAPDDRGHRPRRRRPAERGRSDAAGRARRDAGRNVRRDGAASRGVLAARAAAPRGRRGGVNRGGGE